MLCRLRAPVPSILQSGQVQAAFTDITLPPPDTMARTLSCVLQRTSATLREFYPWRNSFRQDKIPRQHQHLKFPDEARD